MARTWQLLLAGVPPRLVASCTSVEARDAVIRLFKGEELVSFFIHYRKHDRWPYFERVQLSTSEKVQRG